MKTRILTALLPCLMLTQVQAQLLTAEKGLEKIKHNLDTAVKNKNEYSKNLVISKNNMVEVQKAKDMKVTQKKSVSSEIIKNNDSLKKITLQERDISIQITKEKDKIALETKQIEQLQIMINQIKKNLEQRNLNIADYQKQLAAATDTKKAWKDREAQLLMQENQTNDAVRGVASEESTWASKKKKYEGDVKHWTVESEKQLKIHNTYEGLAQGK